MRLALAIAFALSVSGCRCVDLTNVSFPPPGGGGGGSDGGGSGGSGGAGGGDFIDAAVPCGPTNCDGCCVGDVCQSGTADDQCGLGGYACMGCGGATASDPCTHGVCEACAKSCTSGCCLGTTCNATPTAQACGPVGGACHPCGITADSCSPKGQCECGDGGACPTGQRCTQGRCACDAQSCPRGCCSAEGACIGAGLQTATQCGGGGSACGACDSPPLPTCKDANTRLATMSLGDCTSGACGYAPVEVPCAFGCNGGLCMNDVCQGCLSPQPPTCVGRVRRSFIAPGLCDVSGCTYTQQDVTCSFGCSNGNCLPDPCTGLTCDQPPSARCSGNNSLTYAAQGSCTAGACTYAPTTIPCQFGCNMATGACNGDPCSSGSCVTPPMPLCLAGGIRRSFVSPGACTGGNCAYAPQDITCASGCDAGTCLGDPCSGVTCNIPPSPICLTGSTRRTYMAMGTCSGGSCAYAAVDTMCQFGCVNGGCMADPCAGVTCAMPPSPVCASGNTRRVFNPTGACMSGMCNYPYTDSQCSTPPATVCANATTRRTFSSAGTCSAGTCSYAPTDTACPFGCVNGTCNPDPCMGISCTTPPSATCANGTTRRAFANPGMCSGSSCTYAPIDTVCNSPPAAMCLSGTTLRTFSAAGTCTGLGVCGYPPTDTTCANGCTGGACNGDPCSGVNCNAPPATTCASSTARRTFAATGTCSGGTCTYAPTDTTCNTPPGPTCISGTMRRTYAATGSCSGAGVCSYAPTDSTCTFGCSGGSCNPDPCMGVSCSTPPAADCFDVNTTRSYQAGTCSGGTCSYPHTLDYCDTPAGPDCSDGTHARTYQSPGTCNAGSCYYGQTIIACDMPPPAFCVDANTARTFGSGSCGGAGVCGYPYGDTTCGFGCTGGVCNGDPCAGVMCNSPPATVCVGNFQRVFNSSGTCGNGNCSYGFIETLCANGCGGGVCLNCDATTCPSGCCYLNTCYVDTWNRCGSGGGSCISCNVTRTDNCVGGICRCGNRSQCPPTAPICDGANDTCEPLCAQSCAQ